MPVKRLIALYDIHSPDFKPGLLNAVIRFIKWFKPDILINGGDLMHLDCISHHNRHQVRLRESKRLQEDYKYTNVWLDKIDKAAGKKCEKVYIIGNHDDWIQQSIDEEPNALEGFIEFDKNLRFKERGYKVIPLNWEYEVGKLTFIHGNQLTGAMGYAGRYHAVKALDIYPGTNIVYGHFHTHQVIPKISPVKRKAWEGTCVPCIGNVNPYYMHDRPSAWMNGFYIAYINPDGTYSDYVIKIFKRCFVYAGKTWECN